MRNCCFGCKSSSDNITVEKTLIEGIEVQYLQYINAGKTGVLNLYGKQFFEVPAEFDAVTMKYSSYFTTTLNKLNGLYSAMRNVNIVPKYQSVRLFSRTNLNGNKTYLLFEAITPGGKKIIVGANGKEYGSDFE